MAPVTSQIKMAMKMDMGVDAQGKQESVKMEMGTTIVFSHPKK